MSAKNLVVELDSVRETIARIGAEFDALRQRPLDRVSVLARIDAWIDHHAKSISWPRGTAFANPDDDEMPSGPRFSVTSTTAQLGSLLAIVAPEILRARFVGDYDAATDNGSSGISKEALAARQAALTAELLEAETREEKLVRAIDAAGHHVERRLDITNWHVLALRLSSDSKRLAA